MKITAVGSTEMERTNFYLITHCQVRCIPQNYLGNVFCLQADILNIRGVKWITFLMGKSISALAYIQTV